MTSLYRMGSQAVALEGELPPRLAGLRAMPIVHATPAVTLSIALCERRDWPLGPDAAATPELYTKGQPAHWLEVNFADRRIVFRTLRRLSPTDAYLFFRDLFCSLAGLSGEALLHAAAVIGDDASAVLFCGPSGAGKSTVAALLRPRAEVVNDEINWAFWDAGRWLLVNQRCWWRSGSGRPAAVPLRRIFLLEQARRCALAPVSSAAAYPLLLAAPFGGRDPLLPRRAEATAALSREVPLARLEFSLDAGGVENLVFERANPR